MNMSYKDLQKLRNKNPDLKLYVLKVPSIDKKNTKIKYLKERIAVYKISKLTNNDLEIYQITKNKNYPQKLEIKNMQIPIGSEFPYSIKDNIGKADIKGNVNFIINTDKKELKKIKLEGLYEQMQEFVIIYKNTKEEETKEKAKTLFNILKDYEVEKQLNELLEIN